MNEKKNAVCFCDRCKRPLQIAERRRPDSKPFRLAKVPKGVCPDCVMTQFLYNTYPLNYQIDQAGPELLLKPGIPEAFVASGLLDGCDMTIDEVCWPRVVNNWNLPVEVKKGDPRNPYRMGEAKRDRLPTMGMFDEPEEMPPGITLRGVSLVVDARAFKAGGGGKGKLGEAIGGLLDALDKRRPQ